MASRIALSVFSDVSAIDLVRVSGDACVAFLAADVCGVASVLGAGGRSCSREHIRSDLVVKKTFAVRSPLSSRLDRPTNRPTNRIPFQTPTAQFRRWNRERLPIFYR